MEPCRRYFSKNVSKVFSVRFATREAFPEAALEFLDTLMGTNAQRPPRDLGKCLDDIKTADPGLEEDHRFRRLMDYLRRRGEN
jgi:hypothetical protein